MGYTVGMGSNAGQKQKKSHSRKTKKRLAAKQVMLAAKKRKIGRASHH
jgi:hypothetical protein